MRPEDTPNARGQFEEDAQWDAPPPQFDLVGNAPENDLPDIALAALAGLLLGLLLGLCVGLIIGM